MKVAVVALAMFAALPGLAQDQAAKPAPLVSSASTPVSAAPRSLADVARERIRGKGNFTATTSSAPRELAPGPKNSGPSSSSASINDLYSDLSGRYAATKAKQEEAAAALARADLAMPSVVCYGSRPCHGYAEAMVAREGALLQYRMEVDAAAEKIRAIMEEARKEGLPGLAR